MTVTAKGVQYATINDAILSVWNNTPIILDEDHVEDVQIFGGMRVIIDLNGHKLSSAKSNAITVLRSGEVVIKDSSEGKEGKVESKEKLTSGVFIMPGGTAYISGGTIASAQWYPVQVYGSAVVSGDAKVFSEGNSSAIRVGWSAGNPEQMEIYGGVDASLTVNGGEITANSTASVKIESYAQAYIGGGKFVSNGNNNIVCWDRVTITGGEFQSPKVNVVSGFNPDTNSTSVVTIEGGKFTSDSEYNVSPVQGFGSEYDHDLRVEVTGGYFNKAVPEAYVPQGVEFKAIDGTYTKFREGWDYVDAGGAAGLGYTSYKRLLLRNERLAYTAGGFELPVEFMVEAVMFVSAKGGNISAWYDKENGKVVLYSGAKEASGDIEDLTIGLIGH